MNNNLFLKDIEPFWCFSASCLTQLNHFKDSSFKRISKNSIHTLPVDKQDQWVYFTSVSTCLCIGHNSDYLCFPYSHAAVLECLVKMPFIDYVYF